MSIAAQRHAIIWYGQEGRSTVNYLLRQGVAPEACHIFDKNTALTDIPPHVGTTLWSSYLQELDHEQRDRIWLTPGLTKHMMQQQWVIWSAWLQAKITTQLDEFLYTFQGTLIAVSGSKWKSTTASLIAQMCHDAWHETKLLGNIGIPVLDLYDQHNQPAIIVYELSSFMLEAAQQFTCTYGVLTTLTEVHTQEHGGHDIYLAAKLRLLDNAQDAYIGAQAREVLERRWDAETYRHASIYGETGAWRRADGYFYHHQEKIGTDEDMRLLGVHNRYNACVCFALAERLAIPYTQVEKTLQAFHGLEHRLEYVGKYANKHWYDDSIATAPLPTQAAVETFGTRLGCLFFGGVEGAYDFTQLAQMIDAYEIPYIVLFPDTGPRLQALLDDTKHTYLTTTSMEEAVRWAAMHAPDDSVVLLSSASPSFSLWKNYKEKGKLYQTAIQALDA